MDFLNLTTYYNNQFGFPNILSKNHALISVTEKIRKTVDNEEIACSISLGEQKAFDTFYYKISLLN